MTVLTKPLGASSEITEIKESLSAQATSINVAHKRIESLEELQKITIELKSSFEHHHDDLENMMKKVEKYADKSDVTSGIASLGRSIDKINAKFDVVYTKEEANSRMGAAIKDYASTNIFKFIGMILLILATTLSVWYSVNQDSVKLRDEIKANTSAREKIDGKLDKIQSNFMNKLEVLKETIQKDVRSHHAQISSLEKNTNSNNVLISKLQASADLHEQKDLNSVGRVTKEMKSMAKSIKELEKGFEKLNSTMGVLLRIAQKRNK